MNQMPALLLCYGEGGHHEQARRVIALLQPNLESARVVCITDRDGIGLPDADETIVLAALREKHRTRRVGSNWSTSVANLITGLWKVGRYCGRGKATVVSLGPAFVVLPSIVARLFGQRVVHIETWSRFHTRSITGRLMHRIATDFWVQNDGLLDLYSRALHCGRL